MFVKVSHYETSALGLTVFLGAWLAFQLGYFLNLNSSRDYLVYLALAPLLEEYVFRSHLQQWINDRWSAPWIALILSSLVFVMCHIPWMGWLALGLFVPALILGWYWLRFKSLWLNTCLHSVFNASLALVSMAA